MRTIRQRLRVIALLVTLLVSVKRRKRTKRWQLDWISERRRKGAYHSLLNELRSANSARNFLRMDEQAFADLVNRIRPSITKQNTVMRESISAEERLAVTLRFLATGDSFASLAYLYRIQKSTISTIIPEVCDAIYTGLVDDFMKVPRTTAEWLAIEAEFSQRWQLPHCVGAIDGKHVQIVAPKGGASQYYNYKGFHSVVFLAVVDGNYNFMVVDVGYNGRMSDRGLYNRSPIAAFIGADSYGWPQPTPLPGVAGDMPYYIVGDNAFPLTVNLMKPYAHRQLSSTENIFNYRLSRARRIVENAFGILSSRFRVLRRPLCLKLPTVDKVVLACCVLHNFLRKHQSARLLYAPPFTFDSEDADTGELRNGEWRSEGNPPNIRSFRGSKGGSRPRQEAESVQDRLHDYVNGPGRVSWQDRMTGLQIA